METNSFSASFSMPQRNMRNLFKALIPPTKPDNLKYPNKKRKWRIRKKWFNRYEKQTWLGRRMVAEDKAGNKINMEITSVKMRKTGLSFEAKPIKHIQTCLFGI